jgi:hypothetical protein
LLDLAKKRPFYLGLDLKNPSVAAALNCAREENDLAKAHIGEHPCEHSEKRTLSLDTLE